MATVLALTHDRPAIYNIVDDGVVIVRVLHGARDIEGMAPF